MKIYLDNNLGVTNVEQEELTQDTIGYNILKVYIPNAVLTPYDTFTCYYGALLQNGRKVGWFAMEARTNTDADYEENYTLYKATLEQCVVSVEGKVYIGCQVLLGNSGNATLIKKNTAVVQFNVRKSVAINNDILVLDTDQTTTDVLESYKNLLENALTTYATKATTYTKTESDNAFAPKANTYTKTESDNLFAPKDTTYSKSEADALLANKADKSTAITHTGNQLQDYSGNNIYPNLADGSVNYKKLNSSINNAIQLITPTWEFGTITSSGDVSNNARVRCEMQHTKYNMVVKSPYIIDVFYYDDNNVFESETGWINSKQTTIEANKNFRIICKKDDNSGYSDSDLLVAYNMQISVNPEYFFNEYTKDEVITIEKELLGNVNVSSDYNIEIGTVVSNSGEDSANSARLRTKLICLSLPTIISITTFEFSVIYFEKGSWASTAWQTTPYQIGSNIPFRVVFRHSNNSSMSASDVDVCKRTLVISGNLINVNEYVKKFNVNNYPTISKYQTEYVAHCSMFDVKKGNVYCVYYGNDDNVVENYYNLGTTIRLSKFNICNPYDTTIVDILKCGDTIGGTTLTTQAPYDPNILIIDDEYLHLYIRCYYNNEQYYNIVKYNMQTNTIVNQLFDITIDNLVFSVSNIKTLYYNATGVNPNIVSVVFSSHIILKNGYYYALITAEGEDFGGMLIKSENSMNWEVVKCFATTTKAMVEGNFAFDKNGVINIIYRTYQESYIKVFSYNMSNDTVSTTNTLTNSIASKPDIVNLNNSIYILYNSHPTITNDRGTLVRWKLNVDLLSDKMLNYKVCELISKNGLHYPCVINHYGALFMSFSSDLKQVAVSPTLDRSNVGFIELNDFD